MPSECLHLASGSGQDPSHGHLFGERYLGACGISTQGAPLLTADLSASCGRSILFSVKTANFFWTGVLAQDFFHMPP